MNGNAAYFLLFLLGAREEKIICPTGPTHFLLRAAIGQKSIGTSSPVVLELSCPL
jgi:hypothetical protein